MIIFTNTIVQHIKRRWSFGTMLLGRVRGATWNDIHWFFLQLFFYLNQHKRAEVTKSEVITRTHAHTQRNRFYFTKTEHFFYIDTQIQPKLCVICALPTPMPIKKKKKQRKGCCKNWKIHKYCNYCGNPKHISRPSHCTGWAVWLFGGWKRLEAFFLIWMRPLCCNLLNRIVRFNWRRIKYNFSYFFLPPHYIYRSNISLCQEII